VHVADTLDIRRGTTNWTVVVASLAAKRGSAEVAAGMYDETPESLAAREQRALVRRPADPLGVDLGGRPTKQDRRRLDALRRRKRGDGRS
jgi:ribosome-associated heat shock protein Hsp15